MIYNIISLKDLKVVAQFSTRIEAMGYVKSQDPSAVDLFFRAEKTPEDLFGIGGKVYNTAEFFSKLGGAYFC